jgi:hypothetical protein
MIDRGVNARGQRAEILANLGEALADAFKRLGNPQCGTKTTPRILSRPPIDAGLRVLIPVETITPKPGIASSRLLAELTR